MKHKISMRTKVSGTVFLILSFALGIGSFILISEIMPTFTGSSDGELMLVGVAVLLLMPVATLLLFIGFLFSIIAIINLIFYIKLIKGKASLAVFIIDLILFSGFFIFMLLFLITEVIVSGNIKLMLYLLPFVIVSGSCLPYPIFGIIDASKRPIATKEIKQYSEYNL